MLQRAPPARSSPGAALREINLPKTQAHLAFAFTWAVSLLYCAVAVTLVGDRTTTPAARVATPSYSTCTGIHPARGRDTRLSTVPRLAPSPVRRRQCLDAALFLARATRHRHRHLQRQVAPFSHRMSKLRHLLLPTARRQILRIRKHIPNMVNSEH